MDDRAALRQRRNEIDQGGIRIDPDARASLSTATWLSSLTSDIGMETTISETEARTANLS